MCATSPQFMNLLLTISVTFFLLFCKFLSEAEMWCEVVEFIHPNFHGVLPAHISLCPCWNFHLKSLPVCLRDAQNLKHGR